MDDRDLNRLRGLEQDLNQKLEVALTQGDLTALEFLKGIEECRAKIADLIRPSDWTTIPDGRTPVQVCRLYGSRVIPRWKVVCFRGVANFRLFVSASSQQPA